MDIMELVASIQSFNNWNSQFNKMFGIYHNRLTKTFSYFYIDSKHPMNKLQEKKYSKEIFALLKEGHYSYQKTMENTHKMLKVKQLDKLNNNEYNVSIIREELWDTFIVSELI